MKNIDREILKFCKEYRRYGEIVELHKPLNCTESTIKKHITKLKKMKRLTQNNLKEYINRNILEITIENKELTIENRAWFEGLKSIILPSLIGTPNPATDFIEGGSLSIDISLSTCLDETYQFTNEQKIKIYIKATELLDVAIFENMSILDRMKKPGDYAFRFEINFHDYKREDRFQLFKDYSKMLIKKKLEN